MTICPGAPNAAPCDNDDMAVTTHSALPQSSPLVPYRERRAYTDAYSLDMPFAVSLADYLAAFYTTPLFKLERLVLTCIGKPSSDAGAHALAYDESRRFAAWTVEARTDNQIVMCDFMSKTRSWLMCEPIEGGTRLWFGSAIVPKRITAGGRVDLGLFFHLLLPFHRVYSVALLASAAGRVQRR